MIKLRSRRSLAAILAFVLVAACAGTKTTIDPDEVAGVYVPLREGGAVRIDTLFLTAPHGRYQEGTFIHRFADSSGELRTDSGTFRTNPSWTDGPPMFPYDLAVSHWISADDSIGEPVELTIWRGVGVCASVGIVMTGGHHGGGTYVNLRSLPRRIRERIYK